MTCWLALLHLPFTSQVGLACTWREIPDPRIGLSFCPKLKQHHSHHYSFSGNHNAGFCRTCLIGVKVDYLRANQAEDALRASVASRTGVQEFLLEPPCPLPSARSFRPPLRPPIFISKACSLASIFAPIYGQTLGGSLSGSSQPPISSPRSLSLPSTH